MKSFINAAFFLLLVFIFTGCATTVSYKSQSVAGKSRPAGYPIPVYTGQQKIPRPTEIIGTISINAGKFTMLGGSAGKETEKILKKAREVGADAVKLVAIEKPDFANPNYRLTADLLRYVDIWESIPISEEDFRAYLAANAGKLDPIEGIWHSSGFVFQTIGIMKNDSMAGRDFVGFILGFGNPVWPTGTKRIDIRRGLEPDSYILTYYLDDFERREIPIILGNKRSFKINVPQDEEDRFIIYRKE